MTIQSMTPGNNNNICSTQKPGATTSSPLYLSTLLSCPRPPDLLRGNKADSYQLIMPPLAP